MSRQVMHLGKPWETTVAFSLGIVSSGPLLHTAGITARDDEGHVVGVGDMRAQVTRCFQNLDDILRAAGASWRDVVKFTIFTTDIDAFNHGTLDIRRQYFVEQPAATLVEVRRLIHPDMLVEVEAIVCLPQPDALIPPSI